MKDQHPPPTPLMRKKGKKPIVFQYAGYRILLDTIASYWRTDRIDRSSNYYTITFILRNGETISAEGNYEPLRDKALAYLDSCFNKKTFAASKCSICAVRNNGKCSVCYSHNNHKEFVAPKEM